MAAGAPSSRADLAPPAPPHVAPDANEPELNAYGRPPLPQLPEKNTLPEFTHSDADKARALRAFMVAGTITAACEAAGIARATWYNWLEADEAFRNQAMALKEASTEELEEEAIRRAKHGSDTLLIFLLKSRRPGIYRDRLTIDVVSPEVTSRLEQQAQAIIEVCPPEIAAKLAARFREIWTGAPKGPAATVIALPATT